MRLSRTRSAHSEHRFPPSSWHWRKDVVNQCSEFARSAKHPGHTPSHPFSASGGRIIVNVGLEFASWLHEANQDTHSARWLNPSHRRLFATPAFFFVIVIHVQDITAETLQCETVNNLVLDTLQSKTSNLVLYALQSKTLSNLVLYALQIKTVTWYFTPGRVGALRPAN